MNERLWVVFDADGHPRHVADSEESATNFGIGFLSCDIREYAAVEVSAPKEHACVYDDEGRCCVCGIHALD
jgi:hypothetical protein